MKNIFLVLSLAVVVASSLTLTGCDNKAPTPDQVQKQQQADEDKKALRGEFKPSEGKKY